MALKKPQSLNDVIGQDKVREILSILISAARQRGEALDHLLFVGSSGLGKATFANIVANEMGVNMKVMTGSAVTRAGEMAQILTNLYAGDVLFIDEINRLNRAVQEVMLPAMENFVLDIVIGKGSSARSIQLKLPHFTVIGTTSKLSQVNEQLIAQTYVCDFVPYDIKAIGKIILSFANQQGIPIDESGANIIAEHGNGNLSQISNLIDKVRKYSDVRADGTITAKVAKDAIKAFGLNLSAPLEERERQPIPDSVKMFVWRRDNGRCVVCGSQEKLEYDHIIPVSMGGSNTERNIQLLCEKHNRSKGANLA